LAPCHSCWLCGFAGADALLVGASWGASLADSACRGLVGGAAPSTGRFLGGGPGGSGHDGLAGWAFHSISP